MIDCSTFLIKSQKLLSLFLTGQFLHQIESIGVVLFGFGVGVEFGRIVPGVNQILNRSPKITPKLEVHGELSGNLRRALSVVLGQLFTSLQVEHDAPLVYQVPVEKILVKGMCKTITCRQGAIG